MKHQDILRIYGESRNNTLQKEQNRLNDSDISQDNKKLIKAFILSLTSKGNSQERITKLTGQLRRILKTHHFNLATPTKQDIDQTLAQITTSQLSDETKHDYKRCIKQFYNWHEENDERVYSQDHYTRETTRRFYQYIKKLKRTKTKTRKNGEILLDSDIDQVLEHCTNYKDKFLIKLLHETGMRCSEILSLKFQDITVNSTTTVKVPPMKTEERTIPIIHSLPLYYKWKEIHPNPTPDSYIFISIINRRNPQPLKRDGAQKMIRQKFKEAGISKPCNFHWFRHSRATLLSTQLTEVLLCKYMGWVLGSEQVKNYVHLHENQLTNEYHKLNGIKLEEEEKENKILKCACGTNNEHNSSYCYRCGQPLNITVILNENNINTDEITDELNKTMQILIEIAKNPTLLAKFEQYKIK